MVRRLLLLLTIALLAAACDYREVLRIDADGSAELRIELDVERSDQPDGIWPFMLDWDAAEEIHTEVESDPRQFMIELFALEGTEPWIEDAVEGFVLDIDESRLRIELDWDIADLETAGSGDTVFDRSVVLTDAVVRESDDGTMSLSAPARESAASVLADYFALENDPFTDLDRGPDASPITISVQIQVPGRVLRSDAHSTDGRMHDWVWEYGRAGDPGLQIDWDPRPDDGCELCGAFMPLVILIVALFGILALGVLAATLGLFEAVRVTRRDRRDIS